MRISDYRNSARRAIRLIGVIGRITAERTAPAGKSGHWGEGAATAMWSARLFVTLSSDRGSAASRRTLATHPLRRRAQRGLHLANQS
jgi:hypothetical protein